MRFHDQHVHSRYSVDSEADPAACVEAAIAAGLAGLTFTEHFDTHPDEWEGCLYDDQAYSATIQQLRDRFGSRIFIGKGIEVCYQPSRMDFILDFLSSHEFDVVLLGVHYFGSGPIDCRESWDGLSPVEGTRLYLENVLDAVRLCEKLRRDGRRGFDILAHLDLVTRYTHRFFGSAEVSAFGSQERFHRSGSGIARSSPLAKGGKRGLARCTRIESDLVDQILQSCITADVIPEMNTSPLRQGLSHPLPAEDVIARYVELGGRVVSLGSDAHQAEHVGADFKRACSMLKSAGVESLAVFTSRQRREVAIDCA